MSPARNTVERPISAHHAAQPITAAALRSRVAEVGVLRIGINPRTGRPVVPFIASRLDRIRGGLVRQLEVA